MPSMRSHSKRSKKPKLDNSESEEISDHENYKVEDKSDDDDVAVADDDDDVAVEEDDDEASIEEDEDGDSEDDEEDGDREGESGDEHDDGHRDAEMEELEKQYMDLHSQEQDILKNLKNNKDDDAVKGQAVKNQKALWDKTLEFRFLLQKSFASANRLPPEPMKSSFCSVDENVSTAYSDLITSSQHTLNSLLELQEALLEKNPSADQILDDTLNKSDAEDSDEWSRISNLQKRTSSFRDKAVDKWQRRTQVTTGAAAIKGKLHAFNQNISEQVASYMRDPSRMIKQMQQRRSTVAVFGTVPGEPRVSQEAAEIEGDPELLEDTEFYQQLLKEFFETIDPASSESAFYALKKFQTKKRKVVDRRASKSRKIRYNVHEKIVNFMAPRPTRLPPNTADLLKNLFGLKSSNGSL